MIPPYDPNTLTFHTASASNGNNNCVEVAKTSDGGRAVRDSKDCGQGPVMYFTPAEWVAFLDGVKRGEFDN